MKELWLEGAMGCPRRGKKGAALGSIVMLVVPIFVATSVSSSEYPIDRGSTMISGTFAIQDYAGSLYESATVADGRISTLNFVLPNLGLGLNLGFSRTSWEDSSLTSFAIGPKLAYFVGSRKADAYPFFGIAFNYLTSTLSYDWEGWCGWNELCRGESDDTSTGTEVVIGGGVVLMAGPHLAIVFEGSYHATNARLENHPSRSGSILAVGVGLAGFLY